MFFIFFISDLKDLNFDIKYCFYCRVFYVQFFDNDIFFNFVLMVELYFLKLCCII